VTAASRLWIEEEGLNTSSKRTTNKPNSTTATNTRRAKSDATVDTKRVGVQLTPRDLEALAWITDQYAVRTDVIRWLLGQAKPLSDSRMRAVVARWHRAGLVESRRFFATAPHVVWPTAAGTKLVRPGWRTRPPTLAMLAHHHAVSQTRLAIERRGHGTDWVCERVLYKSRSTPDAHVPDGTFRSSRGPLTAVEVELTVKGADRLRGIVRDLALDYPAVLYVVGDIKVGAAVEAAVRDERETERVRIVALDRVLLTDRASDA